MRGTWDITEEEARNRINKGRGVFFFTPLVFLFYLSVYCGNIAKKSTLLKSESKVAILFMRAYSHPKLYQPVFFLIVQSNNRSSFHPPIVCYPALGYTVEEDGKEEIFVHNAGWASKPVFPAWESRKEEMGYFNGTIMAKKLIVVKELEKGGKKEVTERRVVLYFYVKDGLISNNVTMVRVSALAPIKGSYDGILSITKEFMGDTVPYMFEIREEEDTLFTILASGSATDKVMMIMLFLVPLIIIFYKQLSIILRRK